MEKRVTKVILFLLIVVSIFAYIYLKIENKRIIEEQAKIKLENQKILKERIESFYNAYVITKKDAKIYQLVDNQYIEAGMIKNNEELELKELNITYDTVFFPLKTFDGYYINYEDVNTIDSISEVDTRYKNYIPFNENLESKSKTTFYDINNNLVYSFNQTFNLPIIIKEQGLYGVEFNNQLLYIKNEDVDKIYESSNTDLLNTSGIAVLNYHFFYDEDNYADRSECNQIICMSTQRFRSHLDYIKNNNFFTPTLKELEMYLDGKIQLPKSVVITIDDGWRLDPAPAILAEYQLNGTAFLITSWYDDTSFINDNKYFEYHSHGEDIHNPGICSGGQGGAIKCMNRESLLNDLAKSRNKLNQTNYFCYPFYEYNDYSISVLEEAGFTMAFADGERKAYPGIYKYEIPRYVMFNDTSIYELEYILNN